MREATLSSRLVVCSKREALCLNHQHDNALLCLQQIRYMLADYAVFQG